LLVQVIEPKDLPDAPIDIFDNTFTWPHERYPLRPLGKLTLNKNVCSLNLPPFLMLTHMLAT
jgi:catalase